MRDSLRSERWDSMPVYAQRFVKREGGFVDRPVDIRLQDNSVIKYEHKHPDAYRGIKDCPFPVYTTRYESPDLRQNSLSDFTKEKPTSKRIREKLDKQDEGLMKDLCRLLNFDGSKKFGVHTEELRNEYAERYAWILEQKNICPKCHNAIKTITVKNRTIRGIHKTEKLKLVSIKHGYERKISLEYAKLPGHWIIKKVHKDGKVRRQYHWIEEAIREGKACHCQLSLYRKN